VRGKVLTNIMSDWSLYGFQIKTVFFMTANFISAVVLIIVNKKIFIAGFKFGTFLTVIHFATTYLGLHILAMVGFFEVKRVPPSQMIGLVTTFCGFAVFNNLSLQNNSVGLYQLMKVMTTPVIALIQTFYYKVYLDTRLKLSLIPICVGVGLATVNDVDLNMSGFIYAILGLLSTSFYQIWVKTCQQDLGLNSYQLLHNQSPLAALAVLVAVPLFDNVLGEKGLFEMKYFNASLFLNVILTALLAFCVNVSIYVVIGLTSPISYNVLGHFKLCVLLFSGYVFFAEDMNPKKAIGILMAFTGVVLYTHLKQSTENEWNNRKTQASSFLTSIEIVTPAPSTVPTGSSIEMLPLQEITEETPSTNKPHLRKKLEEGVVETLQSPVSKKDPQAKQS